MTIKKLELLRYMLHFFEIFEIFIINAITIIDSSNLGKRLGDTSTPTMFQNLTHHLYNCSDILAL